MTKLLDRTRTVAAGAVCVRARVASTQAHGVTAGLQGQPYRAA